MPEAKLGYNAKLNYKVGGQGAGGAWTELSVVRDVTVNLTCDEADTTTRASGGFKERIPTLIDASIDFSVLWDPTDAGFTALKDAFFGKDYIGIQALDESGGEGIQGDFAVLAFNRNEALAEAITVDVSLKPMTSGTPISYI